MSKIITAILMLLSVLPVNSIGQERKKDLIKTSEGNLEITVVGHGTLMFSFNGKTIHIDPWSRQADYTKMPKADLILLTHAHPDHLDLNAINNIRTEKTIVVSNESCAKQVKDSIVMKNGDSGIYADLKITALPAYNVVNTQFHPKGDGNGYVITFGDKRVYVAGDTENIPEIKELKDIDIAFLPMNQPYTMTPEIAADAAKAFKPKILYPYHYDKSFLPKLENLIKDEKDIELRIR